VQSVVKDLHEKHRERSLRARDHVLPQSKYGVNYKTASILRLFVYLIGYTSPVYSLSPKRATKQNGRVQVLPLIRNRG